jgi:hypothetical protein
MINEGLNGKNYLGGLNKAPLPPTDEEKAAWVTASKASWDKWKADAITNGVSAEVADKVLAKWQEIVLKYR